MANKSMSVALIADVSNILGEGIVWHPRSNSIYWLDIYPMCTLYAMDLDSRVVRSRELTSNLYCIRKSTNGGLVGLSKSGLAWIDTLNLLITGEQKILTTNNSYRFNDANCDSAGRLWTGTMRDNFMLVNGAMQEPDNTGRLICIDSDGTANTVDYGYGCPNTMAWSPDETIMYCADSVSGWIYAYDFNIGKVELSGRRNFFKDSQLGIPDGSAIDSEGCLWNARWDGAALVRITPDGEIDRVIDLPVSRVTDCAFAGADLQTLYITTASFGLSDEERRSQPLAGSVFSVSLPCAGSDKGSYNHV